ncbi:MAG: hypothetical protein DMG57_01130 [Acidobacteria bacterium]|nr:MAG: hypothetical protein DMG57_01130 [Acidobacteriota bacterium]
MDAENWHRSPAVLLLAAVVLPPAGIVLLWMRTGTGILKKIFGSLLMFAWGVTALVLFFGLRLELDGSGSRPFVNFYRPASHYAKLERSRQLQKLQPVVEVKKKIADTAVVADPAHAEAEPALPGHTPRKETVAPRSKAGKNAQGVYWSDFLGPRRDGHYDGMPILTT